MTFKICIKIQYILYNDVSIWQGLLKKNLKRNSIIRMIYRYMRHLCILLSCLKNHKIQCIMG
jgi:hypothetical protein